MKIKKIYSHTVEFNETHMRKYMAKTYDWDFERQIMLSLIHI